MGNVIPGKVKVDSIEFKIWAIVVKVKFQSATVDDAEKIRSVFEEAGFEEVKQYYYSNPEMMAVFKEQELEFPEDEGDVDSWFLDMSPDQGRAICEAFKIKEHKETIRSDDQGDQDQNEEQDDRLSQSIGPKKVSLGKRAAQKSQDQSIGDVTPLKNATKGPEIVDLQAQRAKSVVDLPRLTESQLAVVRRELRIDELERMITTNKREFKAMYKEYDELIAQRKPQLPTDC